ncbi:MAG TPA: hypothetical protein VHE14_05975, partial [Solirubrobacteraceae bacterium]|nr:hypothetical protein [Solirubrobacteraceae bacterium]
ERAGGYSRFVTRLPGKRRSVAVLSLALATIGWLGAVAPGAHAEPNRSCGWMVRLSGDQVNAAYPDDAAKYWVSRLPIPPGFHLELKGRYPYARYLSFITYTGQTQAIDGLADFEIAPDAGSSNPFVRGADRTAAQRSYTVKIVNDRIPASGRAQNTVYTENADGSKSSKPQGGGVFIVRVYVPDRGRDITGGVGLPDISYVNDATGAPSPLPTCAGTDVPDLGQTQGLADASVPSLGLPDTKAGGRNPPVWRKFTNVVTGQGLTPLDNDLTGSLYDALAALANNAPSGGFFENIHNNYVYTVVNQGSGDVIAFRAKAPTAPLTENGAATMDSGQLRYWSFCTNTPATNFLACLYDHQLPTDGQGRYTLVISSAANRPSNAIGACGVGWLPAGPLPGTPVILRHMLPAADFAQAIQRAAFGTEEATLGAYYPRGTYYKTAAEFARLGCAVSASARDVGGGGGSGGGGSGGGQRRDGCGQSSRMSITVRPRRTVVGRRTSFRFVVTIRDRRSGRRARRRGARARRGAPVRGAVVRFAGHRARTDRRGAARIALTPRRPGRRRASASAPGLRPARASVRIGR